MPLGGEGLMVTVWTENTYDGKDFRSVLPFDFESVATEVAGEVLRRAGCPFDAEVSLTLVDDETMHRINRETRGVDRTTDVLSFPAVAYTSPAAFREAEQDRAGSFDPESGRLMLGDILISVRKVAEQAEAYGHSTRREFAFLVAHSTLHLIGYDHMTPEEEKDMFARQERALTSLGITREAEQTKKDGQGTV